MDYKEIADTIILRVDPGEDIVATIVSDGINREKSPEIGINILKFT